MSKVWFYDNDYRNMPSKSRLEIQFKKVVDSPPPYRSRALSRWGGLHMHYEKIAYSQQEAYDNASGITKSQCYELIDSVKKGLVLCVVFDWDRTLSKTEGLYGWSEGTRFELNGLAFPGDRSVEDYRRYLKGGFEELTDYEFVSYFFNDLDDYVKGKKEEEKRAAIIGYLLNFLYDNKIPIFVLTNSKIGFHSPGIMSKMLNILAKRVIMFPGNIIFNLEGNKEIAIRERIYNHSYVEGIITKEMIKQWDDDAAAAVAAAKKAQEEAAAAYLQIARRDNNKKKSSKTLGKKISGKSSSGKYRSRNNRLCPGPNCNIMGGKRKTRKGKKGRKRRKTNRRRKRKRKSSNTRKLNI